MKNKRHFSFLKNESGNASIIAAFALVVFLAMASVVTDLGLRYYQKSNLQNALDSAALASVKCLPDKVEAQSVALEYIEKNGFSTENVIVEFPEEGVVRVRDKHKYSTLFASIFSDKNMIVESHAAAKYIEKNMSIDFEYLMFYGEDSTFRLNGDFREVAGSVFANGDIIVGCNDAAVIYDIASARSVVYQNRMREQPATHQQVSHQDMPDWDEMIMSIAPVGEESQFTSTVAHITADRYYKYTVSGEVNISSYGTYADGNVICRGNLSTSYTSGSFYIRGDLYVAGDFSPKCPVYVSGNVYVGGDLNTTWGNTFSVDGSLYVGGNAIFQGTTTVKGKFYSGKDLTLTNGNGINYKFAELRCMGNMNSTGAWGAKVTVSGSMFIYKKLALGGGGMNKITGNINVFGKDYLQSDEVCYLNGNLDLKGDVWCNRGIVAFGGNGDVVIHGMVYSGGSIETRSGGDISLNGCMIAEGNININGASHTYNDSGATLSLYSRNGNINLGSQGTELKMWGIVYAPNGDIKISTDGLMIYGSLVSNTITCNIGCGFYIGHNDRTLPFAKTVRVAALIE